MGLNACKTIIFLKNILFECVLNQFKDQRIQIIQFKKKILPEKTFCSHWCRILSQYTYVIAMSFTILYLLCSKLGSLKKHVNVKSLHRVHSIVSGYPMDQPTRLPCPWDSPGKNTGVGCRLLLQGIFPTQGSNPGLPRCRQTLQLYRLSYQGSSNTKTKQTQHRP